MEPAPTYGSRKSLRTQSSEVPGTSPTGTSPTLTATMSRTGDRPTHPHPIWHLVGASKSIKYSPPVKSTNLATTRGSGTNHYRWREAYV